jgi:hypothetical protein
MAARWGIGGERLEPWPRLMVPTIDQIQQLAFGLWLRRGRRDGSDREDWFAAERELTYSLNYRTIAEYPLDGPGKLILGDRRARYCRFCERAAAQVAFGPPRPLLAGGRSPSLYTAAVCNECQAAFRDAQAAGLERFRQSLVERAALCTGREGPSEPHHYSLTVFKALIGCALLVMPESELGYFMDALEWVSNPDADSDGALFEADATCVVYLTPFLGEGSWTSIVRRMDPGAALPYMIYYLAVSGVLLQVQLPLCIRDQDLDGRPVPVPRRSFVAGEGGSFELARALEFRVSRGALGAGP